MLKEELLPERNLEDEKISPETLDKLVITMNDFELAIKDVCLLQ